jgi:hypothetical protein
MASVAGPVAGAAGPVAGDHLEVQHLLLCGIHAVNHLLQEKKLVWNPEDPRLLVPMARSKNPADPKDNYNRINMIKFCESQKNEAIKAGIPKNAIESCNPASGNIPSDIIVNLLKFLGYNVDNSPYVSSAEKIRQFIRAARFKMAHRDFLGIIVNIGKYHWTALTPFLNSCWSRNDTGRLRSRRYAYINSLPDKNGHAKRECIDTLDDIETYLRSLKGLERIIFVYSSTTSYNSIAQKRMYASREGGNITHIVENNSSRRGSIEPLSLETSAQPRLASFKEQNKDDDLNDEMKAAIAASLAEVVKGGRKTRKSSRKQQHRYQSFKARQSHH